MPRPKSETVEGKPPYSYVTLCVLAIAESKDKMVTLAEIYDYITTRFPYYKDKPQKWQNSLRHNLSFNDCFIKIPRHGAGKGNYWTLHPNALSMFEHGTFQRRKKRFKVEADKDREAQTKSLSSTEQKQETTSNLAAYYSSTGLCAAAVPQYNLSQHDGYMQQQLWEQGNLHRQYDLSLPQNDVQHLLANADKVNFNEAKTMKKLDYSIENLLRPDSPKRKKKVYSSAEKTNDSSSSARKNHNFRERGSISRYDSLSDSSSSGYSSSSSTSPSSSPGIAPSMPNTSPSTGDNQYPPPHIFWPIVPTACRAPPTTATTTHFTPPTTQFTPPTLYLPTPMMPTPLYHSLYKPSFMSTSHDTTATPHYMTQYPASNIYGSYFNQIESKS